MLAFTSVYSLESGFFNGLRPIQKPPPFDEFEQFNKAVAEHHERFEPEVLAGLEQISRAEAIAPRVTELPSTTTQFIAPPPDPLTEPDPTKERAFSMAGAANNIVAATQKGAEMGRTFRRLGQVFSHHPRRRVRGDSMAASLPLKGCSTSQAAGHVPASQPPPAAPLPATASAIEPPSLPPGTPDAQELLGGGRWRHRRTRYGRRSCKAATCRSTGMSGARRRMSSASTSGRSSTSCGRRRAGKTSAGRLSRPRKRASGF